MFINDFLYELQKDFTIYRINENLNDFIKSLGMVLNKIFQSSQLKMLIYHRTQIYYFIHDHQTGTKLLKLKITSDILLLLKSNIFIISSDNFFNKMELPIFTQKKSKPFIQKSNPLKIILMVKNPRKELLAVRQKEAELIINYIYQIISFNEIQNALQERIKELSCLYQIAHIGTNQESEIGTLLTEIVKFLPAAMQYPLICSAMIEYKDNKFFSENFSPSFLKITAPLILNKEKVGNVEISYDEKDISFFESLEDPFLDEEYDLINTIASQISLLLEKKIAFEEKITLEKQLLHADRLATIGQLSAGVAHELNEPIGNILGFAQLSRLNLDNKDQILLDLDKIEKASLHARDIIKKLMFFSRQVHSKKEICSINELINDSLYLLESHFKKGGIELKLDYDQSNPKLYADSSQIRQVIINLTVNAIQAMPEGGTLSIETKETEDSLLLIVKDTGEGMSEEVKKQIFLPFFTTKDVDKGTGLGLSVVHGIIISHNAEIDVRSQLGEGSTFTITFYKKQRESNSNGKK